MPRPDPAMTMRQIASAAFALSVAACSSTVAPTCPLPAANTGIVYVVGRGWHADIGIPADELTGPLTFYRDMFPGARTIIFGYAKRTFITAPAHTISEYILGPVPGPAIIDVSAITDSPLEAYEPGSTIVLSLPPGGARLVSDFIWNDLDKTSTGQPRLVAKGSYPGSLLYGARSEYSLLHTCNNWAASLLQVAGEHVSSDGVIFASQLMSRGARAASAQCVAPDAD
jgi:hypothetical protein